MNLKWIFLQLNADNNSYFINHVKKTIFIVLFIYFKKILNVEIRKLYKNPILEKPC